MRSLWAQYIEELRPGQRHFIECEWGFISYSFPEAATDCLLIEDIYVVPAERRGTRGTELFKKVELIAQEMDKEAIVARVELATATAAGALQAQLAVGLVPVSADNGIILTRKRVQRG